jgi:hypothetical protein
MPLCRRICSLNGVPNGVAGCTRKPKTAGGGEVDMETDDRIPVAEDVDSGTRDLSEDDAMLLILAAMYSNSSAYTCVPKLSKNKWHQLGPQAQPSVREFQEIHTSPHDGQYR